MGFPKFIKRAATPFTDAAGAVGDYASRLKTNVQREANRAGSPGQRFADAPLGFTYGLPGPIRRAASLVVPSPRKIIRDIGSTVRNPSAGNVLAAGSDVLSVATLPLVAAGGARGAAVGFRGARALSFSEELGAAGAGKLRTAGQLAAKGKRVGKAAYSGVRASTIPDLSKGIRTAAPVSAAEGAAFDARMKAAEAAGASAPKITRAAKTAATAGTSAAVDIRGIATGSAAANKARLASVTAKIAEGTPKATPGVAWRIVAGAAGKLRRAPTIAFVEPVKDVLTGAARVKNAPGVVGKVVAVGGVVKRTPGFGLKVATYTAPGTAMVYGAGRETLNQIRGTGRAASAETPAQVAEAFSKLKLTKVQQQSLVEGLRSFRGSKNPGASRMGDAELRKQLRAHVAAAYIRNTLPQGK